ncbi:hypothetical protein [Paenibacillus sp. GP183]|jgi:hypothetical protein|uniref:hypothetical protein n=1 Tax=Paenibacillus sp. GP183 TaxID=1882751 RepID=UPI00089B32CC|nr:hypothetical protein [Paenibacillus sp. GP183]SEB58702.1 hypothetical protein SAMN05443246_1210 [Paenibacillus sp. GP183]
MNFKIRFILFCMVLIAIVGCDKQIFKPQDSPQVKQGQKVPYTMLLDDASCTAWKSINEFPPMFQIINSVDEFIPLFLDPLPMIRFQVLFLLKAAGFGQGDW